MGKWHGGKGTRLYRIWKAMWNRCNNPNAYAYERYGGRGIKVCTEWDSFADFRDWALANGYTDELTIDRIDNNKGYSPDNCRWATYKTQANNNHHNKVITVDGVTDTVANLSAKYGVNQYLVYDRLRLGWAADAAVKTPKLHQRRV